MTGQENAMELSAQNAQLYMCCDKVLPSAQGMAIWGDYAFMLYHTGMCAVYDLLSRAPVPVVTFWLASANQGIPSEEYINHSNQCMFSDIHWGGNPIPLLYVTTGNSGGRDQNGFFYRCAVENIVLEHDQTGKITGAHCELIQIYSYVPGGEENHGWIMPCWGCPAWFVDNEQNCIYTFSSKYRTTQEFLPYYEQNRYIITKFPMSDPAQGGFVKLTSADILEQFTVPFDILFTQGGMVKNGKIYYTFGFGNEVYPDGLRIYDLKGQCLLARMDLSRSILRDEEIESCSFYRGKLLCNTNSQPGKIYSLGDVI